MERWLQHPAYRPLAESADGFIGPDGRRRGPSTLAPLDPASLDLITSLYDVLLPHFNSQQFNAGCDEPWELGQGRSRDTVAERGGRVYFDWLMKLHAYLSKRGRRMMFWGDIIIKYPDLVPELPDDILVMEWGYEATHPFERHCQHYADAGIAFYVCPGTSSWNSLVGRADNAVGNIQAAARHGLAHGAEGLLLTDWGDYGHWQPPVASYIGIVYAAGVSWGYERNQALDLAAALNTLIYRDRAGVMGQATLDISNLYQQIGPEHINGQVLAYVLQMAPDQIDAGLARVAEWGGGQPDVRPETLRSAIARIDAFIAALDSARPDRPDADLIRREWVQAAALLRHGATYLLWHQGVGADSAADLLRELDGLIARQRHNWLARSRRGGLEDSVRRFQPLRQAYTDRI